MAHSSSSEPMNVRILLVREDPEDERRPHFDGGALLLFECSPQEIEPALFIADSRSAAEVYQNLRRPARRHGRFSGPREADFECLPCCISYLSLRTSTHSNSRDFVQKNPVHATIKLPDQTL